MMATWEDLEKQVLAHNTEVCARIRQSIGQLPTIKCIDMDDDEGSDEEIFFSPPSSKYLGLELMDKKDAIIVDKSNCTISQEPLPRAVDVNKTASKPFNTNAPGTSLTEQNIYIIKESPQALKESEQVRETSDDAFQMCLAAGETVFNLLDEL